MDPQGDLEVHRSHNNTLAGKDPLLSLEEVHNIINHKIDKTNTDTNTGSGAELITFVRNCVINFRSKNMREV